MNSIELHSIVVRLGLARSSVVLFVILVKLTHNIYNSDFRSLHTVSVRVFIEYNRNPGDGNRRVAFFFFMYISFSVKPRPMLRQKINFSECKNGIEMIERRRNDCVC